MLKIDKGIPMPENRSHMRTPRHQEFQDVLNVMEIGDSVEFAVDTIWGEGNKAQRYSKEGNVFKAMARKQGVKIAQRTSEDKGAIRMWRVE
tara:strand:- start:900 stop:1172 length:273 start_codon:yes stop_codon:yes gene_type:complete